MEKRHIPQNGACKRVVLFVWFDKANNHNSFK
jgi:hypothetical protein